MHHRRRDSIYICRKRCNTDTSASARPNSVRDDDTPVRELALKTIGLSERHVAQVCQLIAAVLHLGNLEFTIERSRDVGAAVVRNTDILALVADFLGVQPSVLGNALSYKTNCTVFLDPDDLAMTLYSLLFAWLDEYISQRLMQTTLTRLPALRPSQSTKHNGSPQSARPVLASTLQTSVYIILPSAAYSRHVWTIPKAKA